MSSKEAFIHDNGEEKDLTGLGGVVFNNTDKLFANLSEDIDVVITSLDEAKELFLHKDIADTDQKRSLLQALRLYVSDTNVIEDASTEDVKLALLESLVHAIHHNLSDADIYKAFPLVYGILYPQSD